MKQKFFIAAALAVGIALSFALFYKGGAEVMNVNQVGSDPYAYSGNITVTGIMADISPENQAVFGMFDIKELKCKTANCNKLYLPVRHQGIMPKPGDELLVSGSFVQDGAGMVFAAKNIKVVRNHKIGG
jgi:hypothetical protein